MAAAKLCECGCGQPAPIAKRHCPKRGYVKGQPHRFIRGHHTRGRRHSAEARAKIAAAGRGRRASEATRQRIAASKRGLRHSAETKAKISRALRGRFVGPAHPGWRGARIGYQPLHAWVARHKQKTGVCSHCGAVVGTERFRGTQWANVSGHYLRDLDDFIELCIPCHSERDRAARRALTVGRAPRAHTRLGRHGVLRRKHSSNE
jgi:hypothetical protein